MPPSHQLLSSTLQQQKAQHFAISEGPDMRPLTPRPPPATPRPATAAPSPRPGSSSGSYVIAHPTQRPSTARVGQPELLSKLLYFVKHELDKVESPPGSDAHIRERLDVFRRGFGHFIAAFGAYSPVLLAVQQAYEDALARADERALNSFASAALPNGVAARATPRARGDMTSAPR